ncbi:MAG: protein kinase domain-containing protein [Prosthecobacter sp.]
MNSSPDLDNGATIQTFTPGARLFDRYVLQRLLGAGRKGDVWLARDDKLGMEVAVKLLKNYPHFHELRGQIGKLLDLTHQSVLRVFDLVGDEKLAGFVMEYYESKPLSTLLAEKQGRPFETTEIQRWVRDLYLALEFAHTKAGLVHKDLRLANLLISPQGMLKVAEFGLTPVRTFAEEGEGALTDSGFVSLPGLSPQVIAGEEPAPQDDLYAAAAAVYEMLTTKPVFPGGNIVLQIQKKVPPKIAERRAELGIKGDAVPKTWEQWIAQSLEKERGKRPASAAAIVEQLHAGTHHDTKRGTARNALTASVGQALGGLRDGDHSWLGPVLKAAAAVALLSGAVWYFWVVPTQEKMAERRKAIHTLETQDEEAEAKAGDALAATKMQKGWQQFVTDHQFSSISFTTEDEMMLAKARERQTYWKDKKETIELEARQFQQRQLDLADTLDRAVKRELDEDREVESPTATALSRAAAIPSRLEAWNSLVAKYDTDAAPQIDDYQAPLSKAKKARAGWQAKAKDQEDSTNKWMAEKDQAFEGLNAYLKLGDKGAQAKLTRVKEFIEGLQKNAPAAAATKILEYSSSANEIQTSLAKSLADEAAAPAFKTLAEFFAGTPLDGKDEKLQKAALLQLQSELKTDGFYQDVPKGEYNEATHAAIKAWQAKKDLPANGRLTTVSWETTGLAKIDPATFEAQVMDQAKKLEEEAKKLMGSTTVKKTYSSARKAAAPAEEPGFWRKVGSTASGVGKKIGGAFTGKKEEPKKKK